jgi:hypothetical protein
MRARSTWLLALAAGVGALLTSGSGVGAVVPHRGLWQVVVTDHGQDLTLALVRVEERDGKAALVVVDVGVPTLKGATVQASAIDPDSLRFTLEAGGTRFQVEAVPDTGKDKGQLLRGTLQIQGQTQLVRLERSLEAELNPAKLVRRTDGADLLRQAKGVRDTRVEDEQYTKAARDFPGRPVVYLLAQQAADRRWRDGASKEEIQTAVARTVAAATPYGPTLTADSNLHAARLALASDKHTGLAVGYARAAVEALGANATSARRADALRVLLAALEKNQRPEEANAVRAQLAPLDEALDAAFRTEAESFAVPPFAGRTGKSNRLVVVELFTNAHSPACVSAEVAGDALLRRYRPTEVFCLRYHLSDFDPDPLANPATAARAAYYGVTSSPSLFVDGRRGPALAGFRSQAESRFTALVKRLDEAVEVPARATLRLEVTRPAPDKVHIGVTAALTADAPVDARVRLRLLLAENEMRYAGSNGHRLHRHVVRAFPGGIEGLPSKDGKVTQDLTVNLTDLARDLDTFLTKAAQDRPFPDGDRPRASSQLEVVALVQDDATKEVWQAAVAAVGEGR